MKVTLQVEVEINLDNIGQDVIDHAKEAYEPTDFVPEADDEWVAEELAMRMINSIGHSYNGSVSIGQITVVDTEE